MMETPDSIGQVKADISKCGESKNIKIKVRAIRNSRTTLGYMEDPKHG